MHFLGPNAISYFSYIRKTSQSGTAKRRPFETGQISILINNSAVFGYIYPLKIIAHIADLGVRINSYDTAQTENFWVL